MIVNLLYSIAVAFTIGFFAIRLIWPAEKTTLPGLIQQISLAIGFGLGASSCIFFLWLMSNGVRLGFRSLILCETFLAVILAVLYFRTAKSTFRIEKIAAPAGTNDRFYTLLTVIFFILTPVAIIILVFLTLKNPSGGWDAWAIWNMSARFLFRGMTEWREVFSRPWGSGLLHPDYPLLLPGIVAKCWGYIGKDIVLAPASIAFLFTAATAAFLSSSLAVLRTKTQGILAGIVLIATPNFISLGALQYADVPLSLFFLATVVFVTMYDLSSGSGRVRFLYIAGMAAGFAAWTKNEGLLFITSFIIARFFAVLPFRGLKGSVKELALFMIGALPLLARIAYLKIFIAPPNAVLSSAQSASAIDKLKDLSRYLIIIKAFMRESVRFGFPATGSIPVLAAYFLLTGGRVTRSTAPGITTSLLTLCFVAAGYFYIYLAGPYDLEWKLATSLDRLFLQLWPIIVFLLFLIAASPEDIFGHGGQVRGTGNRN